MRAFLALDITEAGLIKNFNLLQQEILATGADVKVVEPENLHFTLKFFGEIPEKMAQEIYGSIVDLKTKPIEVRFEGLGCFPSLSRISVIWVGVDSVSSTSLKNLAGDIEARLRQFNFKDERGFSPHLTIARVKSGRNKENLQDFIKKNEGSVFGTDVLTSVKLKKSELTPRGPIYTDIYLVPFTEETSPA